MANEPHLKVPGGFRQEFQGTMPIVLCWTCKQAWRIPPEMYATGGLSPNAWHFLQEHRSVHNPQKARPSERVRAQLPRVGGAYDEVG